MCCVVLCCVPFQIDSWTSLSQSISPTLFFSPSLPVSVCLSLSASLSLSLTHSIPPFSSHLFLSLSSLPLFSHVLSLSLSPTFFFSSLSSLPRFPIWTVGEYKLFDALIKVLCAIGLPMVVYFVISSLMDPKLRKTQYLRICYASTAIGLSVYVLGMADSPDKYFCKDNAISYNIIYDGKSFKILA